MSPALPAGPALRSDYLREEANSAFAVLKGRPDIELAIFDPARGVYRKPAAEWRDRILGPDAALVVRGKVEELGGARWCRQPPIMLQLDDIGLLATSPIVAAAIHRLERMTCSLPYYNFRLTTGSGGGFHYVPTELALSGPIAFARGDTVITTGYHRSEPRHDRAPEARDGYQLMS